MTLPVEVVELGTPGPMVLAYDAPDPLAGATIISVTTTPPPAGTGGATGPAGGVLSGNFPNPGFAVDMATQAELESTVDARVAMHRYDDDPHPAYDDLPSMSLIFQNGLI